MASRDFKLTCWLQDDDRQLELLVAISGRSSWKWLPLWAGLSRPPGACWFEIDRVQVLAVNVALAESWYTLLLPSPEDEGRQLLDQWCQDHFQEEIQSAVNRYLIERDRHE
jgi:hypothetical protein